MKSKVLVVEVDEVDEVEKFAEILVEVVVTFQRSPVLLKKFVKILGSRFQN